MMGLRVALGPQWSQVGGVEVEPLLLVHDVVVEPGALVVVPQDFVDGILNKKKNCQCLVAKITCLNFMFFLPLPF